MTRTQLVLGIAVLLQVSLASFGQTTKPATTQPATTQPTSLPSSNAELLTPDALSRMVADYWASYKFMTELQRKNAGNTLQQSIVGKRVTWVVNVRDVRGDGDHAGPHPIAGLPYWVIGKVSCKDSSFALSVNAWGTTECKTFLENVNPGDDITVTGVIRGFRPSPYGTAVPPGPGGADVSIYPCQFSNRSQPTVLE